MPNADLSERTPNLRLHYETDQNRNDNWILLDDFLVHIFQPGSPIQFPPTGVTPGAYGNAATIPVITVDQAGRILAVALVAVLIGNANITDLAYTKLTGAPTIPTTLPPSGPAGGDLAGSTYPNPAIAPGAVSRAKLTPNAPCGVPVTQAIPTSQTWSGPLAFTTVASLTTNTRGGSVFLFGSSSIAAVATAAGGANASLRWLADGSRQVTSVSYLVNTDTHHVPLATLGWVDAGPGGTGLPAGTHTYAFQLALESGITALSSNLVGGTIMAMEVG